MIEMWDTSFAKLNPEIESLLQSSAGVAAFQKMHAILDKVWSSCVKVLREGGILCVNIGDATRTIGGNFCLYPNHARIAQTCLDLKLNALPTIIWRKQTNAPNKFMGSGMLPAGAYVTLEHEYVLIYRKGGKREFQSKEASERRRCSAFFWEERNQWFSDLWEFKGERQRLNDSDINRRSAAFPIELPSRLIAMYSVQGDTVLDPFVGTGTMTLAAIALGRNSIGFEADPGICEHARNRIDKSWREVAPLNSERLEGHLRFVADCMVSGKALSHQNARHGFPVMTQQEVDLQLSIPIDLVPKGGRGFKATHRVLPPQSTQFPTVGIGRVTSQPTLKVWE